MLKRLYIITGDGLKPGSLKNIILHTNIVTRGECYFICNISTYIDAFSFLDFSQPANESTGGK